MGAPHHPAYKNRKTTTNTSSLQSPSAYPDQHEGSSVNSDGIGVEHPSQPCPGGLLNSDIEQIIRRTHTVALRDTSTIGSHRKIPKGFQLQAGLGSQTYNQQIHHLETKASELRATRTAKRNTIKKIKFGFDPKQVIDKHALSPSSGITAVANTLTTDIHPLFAYDRFYECCPEIYEVLKPALRLASTLLLHPAAAIYWHTLAFGDREVDQVQSIANGSLADSSKVLKRIRSDVPYTVENAVTFNRYLLDLVKFVRIGQESVNPGIEGDGIVLFGCCFVAPGDMHRRHLPLDDVRCRRMYIDLHSDVHTTAKRLSLLKGNADPAMVLRYNFFVAVTLCHEVAHFLEIGHNPYCGESFFNDNHFNEAGNAFEVKVFGGKILPVSDRLDCAYGLSISNILPPTSNALLSNEYFTISMDYISRIQQQTFWDQTLHQSDPKALHIPRDGARAIGICALNMDIWDDEAEVKCVDALIDPNARDAAFRRTFDGRIIKNGRTGQTKRPNTREMYGTASNAGRNGRVRSEKQIEKAKIANWKKILEMKKFELLAPVEGLPLLRRRNSV
ncbi:hypothetical protein MBLNU457_5753t1 [Dothideomycetes sp. NU457]